MRWVPDQRNRSGFQNGFSCGCEQDAKGLRLLINGIVFSEFRNQLRKGNLRKEFPTVAVFHMSGEPNNALYEPLRESQPT